MVPERLPLFCIRNVGRAEGNIHAKADLPKHVFVNRTLMSVDLSACLKFNQVSHICSAQLHLQPTCLSEASTCTLMTKQYDKPEWTNGFYGYALATDRHCQFNKPTEHDRHDESTRLMVLSLFLLMIQDNYIVPRMFTCHWRRVDLNIPFIINKRAPGTSRKTIKNLFQQNGQKCLN